MFKPHEFQLDLINKTRVTLRTKNAVIIRLSTGGGKTVISSNICAMTKKPVLYLVHKIELVKQTLEKLRALGLDAAAIHPDFPEQEAQIQVASIQTLVNRLKNWRNKFKIIFVDECHHAKATTWEKCIRSQEGAKIIGLTATPWRLDNRPLGDIFEEIIEGVPTTWLIKKGFLVKPRYVVADLGIEWDMVGKNQNGEYISSKVEALVDNPKIIGHPVQHYKKTRLWKTNNRLLLFCTSCREYSGGVPERGDFLRSGRG